MTKLISIQEAAKLLGVSVSTLRRWDNEGVLVAQRTDKGHRRYDSADLLNYVNRKPSVERRTIAYARVATEDEKDELKRQQRLLELYCSAQGWTFEMISDIGNSTDFYKKGLERLLESILCNSVQRLVITHSDRLLRIGAELIFLICAMRGIDVEIINHSEEIDFQKELKSDLLEIVQDFSERLYGQGSRRSVRLLQMIKNAL